MVVTILYFVKVNSTCIFHLEVRWWRVDYLIRKCSCHSVKVVNNHEVGSFCHRLFVVNNVEAAYFAMGQLVLVLFSGSTLSGVWLTSGIFRIINLFIITINNSRWKSVRWYIQRPWNHCWGIILTISAFVTSNLASGYLEEDTYPKVAKPTPEYIHVLRQKPLLGAHGKDVGESERWFRISFLCCVMQLNFFVHHCACEHHRC